MWGSLAAGVWPMCVELVLGGCRAWVEDEEVRALLLQYYKQSVLGKLSSDSFGGFERY